MSKAIVKVEIRNVLYRNVVYPVSKKAKAFAKFFGTKTFTPKHLKAMDVLGHPIVFTNMSEKETKACRRVDWDCKYCKNK